MLRKLLLLALSSIAASSSGAPSITDVNVTSDGYIEIWGSNFGTKTNVKPLLWLDYESDNDPNLYRLSSGAFESHGQVVADPKDANNKTLYFNMATSSQAAGPGNIPFNSKFIYVNVQRYYDFSIDQPELLSSPSGGGLNLKPFRLWTADLGAANKSDLYYGYQGLEGVYSGRIMAEVTEPTADWPDKNMPFVGRQWNHQEVFYSASDLNTANGYMKVFQNANRAVSRGIKTIDTGHPNRYSLLFFDQTSNYELPSKALGVYYDDVYIDETFARVTLANTSDVNTYSEALPVIPVVWQNDYIKAKLTRATKAKEKFYVFVFDEQNANNAIGFRHCPKCPKAPTPN